MESQPPPLHPFLEFLKANQEDAGIMADLRCALIPARQYRAWRHIALFFPLENNRERTIAATVAAAFATQPENGAPFSNMGDTLRRIAIGDRGDLDGLSSFASRFLRLLACDSPEELSVHLSGIFRTARQRQIPINHQELFRDLRYWSEPVKRRWADHYYRAKADAGQKDAAGHE